MNWILWLASQISLETEMHNSFYKVKLYISGADGRPFLYLNQFVM